MVLRRPIETTRLIGQVKAIRFVGDAISVRGIAFRPAKQRSGLAEFVMISVYSRLCWYDLLSGYYPY